MDPIPHLYQVSQVPGQSPNYYKYEDNIYRGR